MWAILSTLNTAQNQISERSVGRLRYSNILNKEAQYAWKNVWKRDWETDNQWKNQDYWDHSTAEIGYDSLRKFWRAE